jgi:dinuclear metal center YbgI/SA1388 family protein
LGRNVQNPTFDHLQIMIQIKDIIHSLETWAPPSLQESYDNARLITGSLNVECTGALICLDSIECIVDEAIESKCNLIIAHHPIVFSGLKSLTGKTYIERTIIKAIQNNIAIYAIHTNLDSVSDGVSFEMARRLGLENIKVLEPKGSLISKLVTYVPESHVSEVRDALFAAGAGKIGAYDECSFVTQGFGTFKPNEQANPFLGKIGERHSEKESRLEVLVPNWLKNNIYKALQVAHPYEEVAYEFMLTENLHQQIGFGAIGNLPQAINKDELLNLVKTTFGGSLRYTHSSKETIHRIALCGGSGSSLLKRAISAGADCFITADVKYHQFFDALEHLMFIDIGHFESEQFTINLIHEFLNKKFPNFAARLTVNSTNPIHYF